MGFHSGPMFCRSTKASSISAGDRTDRVGRLLSRVDSSYCDSKVEFETAVPNLELSGCINLFSFRMPRDGSSGRLYIFSPLISCCPSFCKRGAVAKSAHAQPLQWRSTARLVASSAIKRLFGDRPPCYLWTRANKMTDSRQLEIR